MKGAKIVMKMPNANSPDNMPNKVSPETKVNRFVAQRRLDCSA